MAKKYLSDIIALVAENCNKSKKETKEMIESFLGVVSETLVAEDEVALNDFGTFKPMTRKAYQGRNPQSGETVDVPEKKYVAFKQASRFTVYNQLHKK